MSVNLSQARTQNVSIASLVKEAVDVSHMEIKTSKLLNVIEHEKYVHLQKMIDEQDFQSRMKIKKKDWFINPD